MRTHTQAHITQEIHHIAHTAHLSWEEGERATHDDEFVPLLSTPVESACSCSEDGSRRPRTDRMNRILNHQTHALVCDLHELKQ